MLKVNPFDVPLLVGRQLTPTTNFTPTITFSTGPIASAAGVLNTCCYSVANGGCWFALTFKITANGAGAGYINATLPLAASSPAVVTG